jgi:hypothetical protein
MNDYFRRPREVLDALRFLGRSGLRVSLPELRSGGQMFFKIEERMLSVGQILELVDRNRLDSVAIREYGTQLLES